MPKEFENFCCRKGSFMDEFKDLGEILTAAKEISEKLQARKNFLTEEISKLREENQRILAERNNLLIELNSLLAENERLRKVNESFGNNLQQVGDFFKMFIGNGSRKNLTDSENDENSIVPTETATETATATATETEILDAEENLPANLDQSKKKMVYAEFFAEEIGYENQNS